VRAADKSSLDLISIEEKESLFMPDERHFNYLPVDYKFD
jgi:hypothetical protein